MSFNPRSTKECLEINKKRSNNYILGIEFSKLIWGISFEAAQ